MKNLNELQVFDDDIPPKEGERLLARDYLLKPDIEPYLVYSILKEQFGLPNGNSFDEQKTQWGWFFTYQDFHIEIYDWKVLSISIAIYHQASDEDKSEKLAEKIANLLLKSAQQKKSKLKQKAKESKRKILENPFITYYSTAENLMSLSATIDNLSKVKTDNLVEALSKDFSSSLELWDKKSDIYRSAFLMFLSSFEGFLNILYELYLKDELRADRIQERISREQIDIKLRMAPIYCNGFKAKTIDHQDSRFKNYQRLVNLRNDYVHANIIKSLERYIVEEDECIFIIENDENSDIPSNINELEENHVEIAQQYIDDVVELVFESMEPKTRREFKRVIFAEDIEVEEEDGILIPV